MISRRGPNALATPPPQKAPHGATGAPRNRSAGATRDEGSKGATKPTRTSHGCVLPRWAREALLGGLPAGGCAGGAQGGLRGGLLVAGHWDGAMGKQRPSELRIPLFDDVQKVFPGRQFLDEARITLGEDRHAPRTLGFTSSVAVRVHHFVDYVV